MRQHTQSEGRFGSRTLNWGGVAAVLLGAASFGFAIPAEAAGSRKARSARSCVSVTADQDALAGVGPGFTQVAERPARRSGARSADVDPLGGVGSRSTAEGESHRSRAHSRRAPNHDIDVLAGVGPRTTEGATVKVTRATAACTSAPGTR